MISKLLIKTPIQGQCEGSGHLANVCLVEEDAKSNAMTAVQGEDKSTAVFSSIQLKDDCQSVLLYQVRSLRKK